jgi:coenzyme F420-reducing hydrogenase beta subunit
MSNVPNYTEQGGAVTHIGGTLAIEDGASVTGITTATLVNDLTTGGTDKALTAEQGKVLAARVAANQAESVEATTPTVTEFNALLAKLKAAGLMVADE